MIAHIVIERAASAAQEFQFDLIVCAFLIVAVAIRKSRNLFQYTKSAFSNRRNFPRVLSPSRLPLQPVSTTHARDSVAGLRQNG
jgi:hypothetical protein